MLPTLSCSKLVAVMLFIYRVLIILTAPLALLWLRWKIPGPARLRARWRERLGSVPKTEGGVLWIHAASVGEVNAIAPLAEALLHSWPRRQLVISTMTVTGRAEAVRRFKDRAILVFAPLDTPVAVSRWLKRIRPQLAMVAETEIWRSEERRVGKDYMTVGGMMDGS